MISKNRERNLSHICTIDCSHIFALHHFTSYAYAADGDLENAVKALYMATEDRSAGSVASLLAIVRACCLSERVIYVIASTVMFYLCPSSFECYPSTQAR